jgi:hypothetical protein
MKINRRSFSKYVAASTTISALAYKHQNTPKPSPTEVGHSALYIGRYAPALTTNGERALLSGGAPIGAGRTEKHTHSGVMSIVDSNRPSIPRTNLFSKRNIPTSQSCVNLGQRSVMAHRRQNADRRRTTTFI